MTEIPTDDDLTDDERGTDPGLAEPADAVTEPPEPEPGPEPQPEPHLELLARIEDRLAESQRLLGRQTEIAASLHEENQRLKAGELRRALAPLVRDVLRVQDDVTAMLDTHADPGAARDLDLVRGALLDALARNGIEPIACPPGTPFDPRLHKVAGVVATPDPQLDRCVAAVVRPGFTWDDGEPVRPVDVQVHKLRAPADPGPAATDTQNEADSPDVVVSSPETSSATEGT